MPLRSLSSIARSRRAKSLNCSEVNSNFADGNAFDLCSSNTVNGLITTACDQLAMDGNTVAGNPTRVAQEMLKNCLDAINNGGAVVPVTPCPYAFPNPACVMHVITEA